jgi:hypothetical protein
MTVSAPSLACIETGDLLRLAALAAGAAAGLFARRPHEAETGRTVGIRRSSCFRGMMMTGSSAYPDMPAGQSSS